MIRVETYQPAHLRTLILQDAQAHLQPLIEGPEYADSLLQAGPAWTGFYGDRPLICAGFQQRWEGCRIAWAIVARDAGQHMPAINRAIKRGLALERGRVEIAVRSSFAAGHRWARLFGFEREGTMRGFVYGVDHDLYALVR